MARPTPTVLWTAALLLTAGCDNVGWGGASMELARPTPRNAPEEAVPDSSEALPPLPAGPVLYLAQSTAEGPRILPVAEITSEGLSALPATAGSADRLVRERMAPGTIFHVFADGMRVGRFTTAGGVSRNDGLCGTPPDVAGILEVTPEAAGIEAFLALPDSVGATLPRGVYEAQTPDRSTRFESRRIFGEEIPRLGARWPSNLDAARADLSLFRLDGSTPAMASTYLFRDELGVGEPREGAYAMMIVAERGPERYDAGFTWYRPIADGGKAAARFVGALDWDGDGQGEILLRVFGSNGGWFAALDRESGTWGVDFDGACGG